jgi:hypothetical protein
VTVDVLVERDQIVCDLRDALRDGESGLQYVPRLLRRVLETEAWRERYDRSTRKPVPFRNFAEFATSQPTEGLGGDLALIHRIVGDDPETLDLLDRALQNAPHAHRDSDNIRVTQSSARGGTSKEYALRRLRSQAPELHAKVLSGNLSPHAAMVQAGFRPPTFTVRGDKPEAVAATLRKQLSPEVLAEVARLLAD